jgi:hypothetical protein
VEDTGVVTGCGGSGKGFDTAGLEADDAGPLPGRVSLTCDRKVRGCIMKTSNRDTTRRSTAAPNSGSNFLDVRAFVPSAVIDIGGPAALSGRSPEETFCETSPGAAIAPKLAASPIVSEIASSGRLALSTGRTRHRNMCLPSSV